MCVFKAVVGKYTSVRIFPSHGLTSLGECTNCAMGCIFAIFDLGWRCKRVLILTMDLPVWSR